MARQDSKRTAASRQKTLDRRLARAAKYGTPRSSL